MKTSFTLSALRRLRSGKQGFSLVEVTIALGVTAFALVALFGMLPTGLNLFRSSMDTSVKSQISQQLVAEATQTDFETILTLPDSDFRYFSDEGVEVPETESVYTAQVSYDKTLDGLKDLREGVNMPTTPDLVRFQIKIIRNPSHKTDIFPESPTATPPPGMDTFTAFISRNQSKPRTQ